MKVGFIGLGIMGAPMAGHLLTGGHNLYLHDMVPDLPAELLQGGGVVCGTGRAVATAADVIILMVPDTPDVQAALFDPGGIAEGLSPGITDNLYELGLAYSDS